jgi:hypothetical protein
MLNPRGLALLAALGFALCTLACGAPRASAQEADSQQYRTTIDDAVREFASGHWEEARALFKRAHDISPNARTLRGMGMAAFELRMYTQAIRELDAALRDTRKPLEGELRAQVSQLMVKAREFVGRVTFVVDPPEAKLLIDGKDPEREPDGSVLLDVGTHVISASADRYKPTNLRLSVEGGMDESVRVPLEPLLAVAEGVPALDPNHPAPASAPASQQPPPAAPRDHTLQTAAWITLAGAAALGIASGVMYFGVAQGDIDDVEGRKADTCKAMGGCTRADVAQFIDGYIDDSGVHTSETLATVFLIAAGAGAVASGVMFAIDLSNDGEPAPATGRAAPRVKLALSPGAMALRGQF